MATSSTSKWRAFWLLVAIAAALVIWALTFTAVFSGLLLIFAGILFGNFLHKLSELLADKLNIRYGAAFAVIVLLHVIAVGGTASFMGTRISYQIAEFTQQLGAASQHVQQRLEAIGWREWFGDGGSGGKGLIPRGILSTAGSALAISVSAVASVVLVAFLGFYFALQPTLYRDGVLSLVPKGSRKRAAEILSNCSRTLWWWILGRLLGMVIIGTVTSLGLWLLGIPLPITLGVIAGLMNFIPNIGPLLASIPPILFGLQQGTNIAFYVAGFYVLLQFVESYFITPYIDQKQVQLPPGLILSSQLLLGLLAGFLGLLLATPITAVVYVVVHELYVKDAIEGNAPR